MGDLEVGKFLILNVATPVEGSDESVLGRYLQYSLFRMDGDLYLTAEVSSAKYQPVTIQHGPHVTNQLVQRGWPIAASSGNHQRIVPWPEEINQTVAASMEVLCDVWQVLHPAAVSFDMSQFGGSPATPGESSQEPEVASPPGLAESLIIISGWVAADLDVECDLVTEPDRQIAGISFQFNGTDMMISGPDEVPIIEYSVIVTNDPGLMAWLTPELWNAVMDEFAVDGRARLQSGSLILTCAVPSPVLVRENVIEQVKYWTVLADRLAKTLGELHAMADIAPAENP